MYNNLQSNRNIEAIATVKLGLPVEGYKTRIVLIGTTDLICLTCPFKLAESVTDVIVCN